MNPINSCWKSKYLICRGIQVKQKLALNENKTIVKSKSNSKAIVKVMVKVKVKHERISNKQTNIHTNKQTEQTNKQVNEIKKGRKKRIHFEIFIQI